MSQRRQAIESRGRSRNQPSERQTRTLPTVNKSIEVETPNAITSARKHFFLDKSGSDIPLNSPKLTPLNSRLPKEKHKFTFKATKPISRNDASATRYKNYFTSLRQS